MGSAPTLTCSLCACAKALMKLNEAEVLRNSLEKKADVIACFEEATFFSLKGEVRDGQVWRDLPGDGAGCLPRLQGISLASPATWRFLQSPGQLVHIRMLPFSSAGLLAYGAHEAGKENAQGGFEPARKTIPPDLHWSLCQVSGGKVAVCLFCWQKSILPSAGGPVRSRTEKPGEEEPFPTWSQASRPNLPRLEATLNLTHRP